MPRHYRQCHLCSNNTSNKSGLVFFRANEHILLALKIDSAAQLYICEEHFHASDVKIVGNSKRLRQGCLPINFSLREVSLLDHGYVNTSQLQAHLRVVDLPWDKEGLGFNITDSGKQITPIYVSSIVPGGST